MSLQDRIRTGKPYIIAEIGASHNGNFEDACRLIELASVCGADAVKFQAYTPDTITINSKSPQFMINDGPWSGLNLYELYQRAHTPREWFKALFDIAASEKMDAFASVFSKEDADFIEQFNPPAYKISSFELVDIPLIRHVASKKKPMFISTGMVTDEMEIRNAYYGACSAGSPFVMMMHCVSAYPASVADSNLGAIGAFGCDAISDHSIGTVVPVAAVAMGVVVIEKHLTIGRHRNGPDDCFASEPEEFADMVETVHEVYASLTTKAKADSCHTPLRRSLYVVKDMQANEPFTDENIRSIRPGGGLTPEYYYSVIGKRANRSVQAGTPLTKDLFDE